MHKHQYQNKIRKPEVIQKTAFILLFTDYTPNKTKINITEYVTKQVDYIRSHYILNEVDIIGVFHQEAFGCISKLPRNLIKIINPISEQTNETYSIGLALNCTDATSICVMNGMFFNNHNAMFSNIPAKQSFIHSIHGKGMYWCNFFKDTLEISIPATSNKNWDGFCYICHEDYKEFSSICLQEEKKSLLLCELINNLIEKERKVLVYK